MLRNVGGEPYDPSTGHTGTTITCSHELTNRGMGRGTMQHDITMPRPWPLSFGNFLLQSTAVHRRRNVYAPRKQTKRRDFELLCLWLMNNNCHNHLPIRGMCTGGTMVISRRASTDGTRSRVSSTQCRRGILPA